MMEIPEIGHDTPTRLPTPEETNGMKLALQMWEEKLEYELEKVRRRIRICESLIKQREKDKREADHE
jgi:hypothetical protein